MLTKIQGRHHRIHLRTGPAVDPASLQKDLPSPEELRQRIGLGEVARAGPGLDRPWPPTQDTQVALAFLQTGQALQEGCLSRTVRADQGHTLTRVDLEIQPIQGRGPSPAGKAAGKSTGSDAYSRCISQRAT